MKKIYDIYLTGSIRIEANSPEEALEKLEDMDTKAILNQLDSECIYMTDVLLEDLHDLLKEEKRNC
jgi:hypothetical protein